MDYLANAWMLGPKYCGPNALVWRSVDDPRNLHKIPRNKVKVLGSGGRQVQERNEGATNGADTAKDESAVAKGDGMETPCTILPVRSPYICLRYNIIGLVPN
jgi:hypothetical protein